MKKLVFVLILSITLGAGFSNAIPNPWVECGDDIYCGAQKAGFNLPLRLKKYNVRAMNGLLEITFPLDRNRKATIRKTQNSPASSGNVVDISGDYNNYPINKSVYLKNGVKFDVRGNKNKFYVANFSAESGYYSITCDKGLKIKDLNYFYKLLEEAEAPTSDFDETNNYTIEQLQDLRRVDGIVEPVFTQDCFPKTLQKKGVTYECFERANLGQNSFCSASEIKMIKEYYKKGQEKDPLNDGSGNFCAPEE